MATFTENFPFSHTLMHVCVFVAVLVSLFVYVLNLLVFAPSFTHLPSLRSVLSYKLCPQSIDYHYFNFFNFRLRRDPKLGFCIEENITFKL